MIRLQLYRDIFLVLTAAVAFTLPFSIQANSLVISALIIFFFILIPWVDWKKLKFQDFILPFFYILFLLGMVHTENLKEGLFQLEVKMTLLIFPIIFSAFRTKSNFNPKPIFSSFYIAVVLAAFICLGNAGYQFFKTGETTYFFRESLTAILPFHPIYFSLYIAIAVLLKIDDLKESWKSLSSYSIFITIGSLLFLFFFNILLVAKMPLIALLIVGLLYLNFNLKILKQKLIFALMIVIPLLGAIYFLPFARNQFNIILHSKLHFDTEENNANSLTLRLVKWKCSIEGMKKNLLLGVGTGDARDLLQKCYVEKNFWGSAFQYNSHNEYLSTGLRIGIIGLLYLLVSMGYYLMIFYKRKIYFCILILFILCFMTESMFSIQKGIVLFSFLLSIFYNHTIKYSTNNPDID